jgi:putative mRNA 3-end processing factor
MTPEGLYCRSGRFHIDPTRGVERAVITHAHSDHARPGSSHYLCSRPGVAVLRERLGPRARIEAVDYGVRINLDGVDVSLHPAGHVLGSSQVRCEHRGEVWVVSGDYKTEADPTCDAFEPVRCDTFITECTFGLPIYHWRPQEEVFAEIARWWAANQAENRTSVLLAYSLGKAQRILAGLDPAQGPIGVGESVARFNRAYESAGIPLPRTDPIGGGRFGSLRGRAIVVTPPGSAIADALGQSGTFGHGLASGWMALPGRRPTGPHDAGFVLSDHADWEGLLGSIRATCAPRVLTTHGYAGSLARYLREQGLEAGVLDEPEAPGG